MEGKYLLLFHLENSYASNGVKHCIRPCDMSGKSSALILRQMHPIMIREAEKYDLFIDLPSWFSSLSIKENSVTYTQQKSIESEMLIKISELEKKGNKNIKNNNLNNGIDEEVANTLNDIIKIVEIVSMKNNNNNNSKKKGRSKKDY